MVTELEMAPAARSASDREGRSPAGQGDPATAGHEVLVQAAAHVRGPAGDVGVRGRDDQIRLRPENGIREHDVQGIHGDVATLARRARNLLVDHDDAEVRHGHLLVRLPAHRDRLAVHGEAGDLRAPGDARATSIACRARACGEDLRADGLIQR